MKTKEELNAIKQEVESMNKKPLELSEDELKQVSGGVLNPSLQPGTAKQNALDKTLQKLSSGAKINTAADDPSGYQIAERSR